jgi:hypothetical protein
MNAITVVWLAVAMPAFAIGVKDLQPKLERWDYRRQAED